MVFTEINREGIQNLPFVLFSLEDGSPQSPLSRPHGFPYHQILWVTEGSCTYRVGDEVFLLSVGEGIYMRPHVPHSYEGRGLCTAWCTFFAPKGFPDFFDVGDYFYFRVPSSMKAETEQLLHLCLGDSTVLGRSVAGYAYVAEFFSRALGREPCFSEAVDRILERRYGEPLSLLEIGEELGTDRYGLCRRYKEEKGITVMEALGQIRLQKAKQLLQYHAASVEEIGRMCGYASPSYFGKRFREGVGCTPSEYRKRKRE